MGETTKAAQKPSGPIQFTTLNRWRRERAMLEVFLVNGQRLVGRVRSFDRFSMLLEMPQGSCFVFHHTVSTVQPASKTTRRPAPSGKPRPRESGSFQGGDSPAIPANVRHDTVSDQASTAYTQDMRRRPGPAPEVKVVRRTRRTIQRDTD